MPSRDCPRNDVSIEWIYVIDLGLNTFRVSGSDFTGADMGGVKFFRLENIPRALFTDNAITSSGLDFPVISDYIPSKHIAANQAEIPVPSPSLLTLYYSLSPTPTATFTPPAVRRNSVWHNLSFGESDNCCLVLRICNHVSENCTGGHAYPYPTTFTLYATSPPFTDDGFDALDDIGYETPGVLALLDLFVVHPRVKSIRGRVPALIRLSCGARLWGSRMSKYDLRSRGLVGVLGIWLGSILSSGG